MGPYQTVDQVQALLGAARDVGIPHTLGSFGAQSALGRIRPSWTSRMKDMSTAGPKQFQSVKHYS